MTERQSKIIKLVNTYQKIEVSRLAELLSVSQVTIRKDLDHLESEGLLSREHGYALIKNANDINTRMTINYDRKLAIATKAAEMEDNISDKQKGLWLRELLLEQREVSSQWLARFVGKTVEVLAEGEGRTGDGYLTGKTDEGIIAEFEADKKYIGEFVQVSITKAMNWALAGELVEDK